MNGTHGHPPHAGLSELGRFALAYVERGWKVFPAAPIGEGIKKKDGKEPYGEGPTFQQASSDPAQITKWWTNWPNANIGLALAPSGLVALDADIYNNPDGWKHFQEQHDIPPTYVQRTAGGGEHHVFKAEPGVTYPGKLATLPGEIKFNGYILLSPSKALSKGNQGGAGSYAVLHEDGPVVAPQWLAGRVFADRRSDDLVENDAARLLRNSRADDDELLRLLGSRQNLFEDREDWLKVVHGVHYQFARSPREQEAKDAVVDWSQRWKGKGRTAEHTDEKLAQEAEYAWSHGKTDRRDPVTAASVFALLKRMPEHIVFSEHLSLVPHQSRPLSEHPVTEWLCDRHYLRGALSLTVAPGGTGKSMLVLHEAISLAIGKPLIGGEVFGHRRVLYVNGGEDKEAMVRKRVDAALDHHGLTDAALGGRLFIRGAPEMGKVLGINHFKFATQGRNEGPIVNWALVDAIVEMLKDYDIDVLILDPLKHFHLVGENDNDAMNEFATCLAAIAERANCAVEVVHHATKDARVGGKSGNLGIAQSRGASALIDKARTARFLSTMSKDDAEKRSVADGRTYVRIISDKSNYAASDSSERWFRIQSMDLGNGTPEYPEGDSVGVLELAKFTEETNHERSKFALDVLKAVKEVQEVCARSEQASDWLGFFVAEQMSLDVGRGLKKAERSPEQNRLRSKIAKAFPKLERFGALKADKEPTANGKGRQIWVLDQSAIDKTLNDPSALLLLL